LRIIVRITLHPENAIKELRFSYSSHQQVYHNQLKIDIERERTPQFEMKKGLAAFLLLCYVGFLATGTSAQFAEEPSTALESLAQTLEEARNNDGGGFPKDEVQLAETEETEELAETERSRGGVVYTRWGLQTCPRTSTLVYFGRAAGAHYTHSGSGTNYICMPHNPEYYSSGNPATYPAYVYGAEYETWGSTLANLANHNVPCAVCYARRQAVLMAPAKITCPRRWTREYSGYLMASYYGHASPKTFVCVDKDAQPVRGEAANHDGALFYHARVGHCHGLDCPPYTGHKDLACVVCTR